MTEAERRAALDQVAAEVRDCTRCRLHEGRTHAVPGEGHPSTEVLFVGEGPGLNEDRQGRPFVGAAGQFLTELLGTVGWRREDVFITNVVKCRPPQNRDPEPDEIEACAPFLRRQLDVLDPALVVTLGRHSMGRFMPGARIGQVHGTFRSGPPDLGAERALVFAMYHPAAALHQGSLRQTLVDDMAQVPAALLEARRQRSDRAEPAPAVSLEAEAPSPELRASPPEPGPAVRADTPIGSEPMPSAAPASLEPTPAPASGPTPSPPAGPPEQALAPVAIEPEPAPVLSAVDEPIDDRSLESLDIVSEAVLAAVAASADPATPDDQMTLF